MRELQLGMCIVMMTTFKRGQIKHFKQLASHFYQAIKFAC